MNVGNMLLRPASKKNRDKQNKTFVHPWWGCAGAKQVSDGALAPLSPALAPPLYIYIILYHIIIYSRLILYLSRLYYITLYYIRTVWNAALG